MVDLLAEWSASLNATSAVSTTNIMAEILKRMGEIPRAADSESGDYLFSMREGVVSSKDTTLTLTWCSFTHLTEGIPALLDWLVKNGASDFKYDIVSGESFASDEER